MDEPEEPQIPEAFRHSWRAGPALRVRIQEQKALKILQLKRAGRTDEAKELGKKRKFRAQVAWDLHESRKPGDKTI